METINDEFQQMTLDKRKQCREDDIREECLSIQNSVLQVHVDTIGKDLEEDRPSSIADWIGPDNTDFKTYSKSVTSWLVLCVMFVNPSEDYLTAFWTRLYNPFVHVQAELRKRCVSVNLREQYNNTVKTRQKGSAGYFDMLERAHKEQCNKKIKKIETHVKKLKLFYDEIRAELNGIHELPLTTKALHEKCVYDLFFTLKTIPYQILMTFRSYHIGKFIE